MDAKALAKSKRAHSQHHSKKPHPSQKPKSAANGATSTANVKKGPNKHVTEKTRQAQRIAKLPSNRDRYEEEYDLDSDEVSGSNAAQPSDFVLPKSKGSDYRHLIEEAQSQSQSYCHAESHGSLDDVLPGEFNQFLGSMLSVSGEAILSWIGDDNFVVEDRTSASQEASFLSLNLNALAEQLERVELSQRLFIEADLLPPEELGQGSMKSRITEQSDRVEMISEEVNVEYQDVEVSKSGFVRNDGRLSSGVIDLVIQGEDDFASNHISESGGSKELKPAQDVVSKQKLPTFQAETAEAELDMLLNNFSDTKFLDSSNTKSPNTSTNLPQLPTRLQDSSKSPTINASLDDVLDDLLEETSALVNQHTTSRDNQSASSGNVSKSKVLDDFDSWFDTIG